MPEQNEATYHYEPETGHTGPEASGQEPQPETAQAEPVQAEAAQSEPPSSPAAAQEIITRTLADAKSLAREQVSAAWQLQVEKIQETLSTGWQQHISHVLDERFQEMEEQLGPSLTAEFTAREIDLRRQLAAREEEAASLQQAKDGLEAQLAGKEDAFQSTLAEREASYHASLAGREEEWRNLLASKEGEFSGSLATQLQQREDAVRGEVQSHLQESAARVQQLETRIGELDQLAGLRDQEWEQKLVAAVDGRDSQFEERLQAEREAAAREAAAQAEEVAHQAIHEANVESRREGRRELSEGLNLAVRKLGAADSFAEWREALLDGAAAHADRVLIFGVGEATVTVEGARGVDNAVEAQIPLIDAPAVTSAIDTKDTVVAVRTTSEFGERIADLAPETKGAKVYLFPIEVRDRVAAVLYTEPGESQMEVSAVELLASVASLTLTSRRSFEAKPAAAPAVAAAAPPAPAGTVEGLASLMTSLSREEQDLHLRAQRFARVQVAEMRLYKSALVKEGRTKQNIYGVLREEIDLSRDAFRNQFMTTRSMVDYFHLELIHTLANDDAALLGQDYPGPLAAQVAHA